jgi:hypothetical protein
MPAFDASSLVLCEILSAATDETTGRAAGTDGHGSGCPRCAGYKCLEHLVGEFLAVDPDQLRDRGLHASGTGAHGLVHDRCRHVRQAYTPLHRIHRTGVHQGSDVFELRHPLELARLHGAVVVPPKIDFLAEEEDGLLHRVRGVTRIRDYRLHEQEVFSVLASSLEGPAGLFVARGLQHDLGSDSAVAVGRRSLVRGVAAENKLALSWTGEPVNNGRGSDADALPSVTNHGPMVIGSARSLTVIESAHPVSNHFSV